MFETRYSLFYLYQNQEFQTWHREVAFPKKWIAVPIEMFLKKNIYIYTLFITIIALKPRAPVFFSIACLDMALMASGEKVKSTYCIKY
jgi:hypothetical protein